MRFVTNNGGDKIKYRRTRLFLGPPGTGKSHLAQALSVAVIQQGHRVLYREAHTLVDEPADAQLAGHPQDHPRAPHHRSATLP